MNQQLYDVFYRGEVVEGADTARVRDNLAQLFKTQGAGLDRLFSGQPVLIKRGVDRQTALKYQVAMKKAGAICRVRENPQSGGSDTAATTAARDGTLGAATVAPPGTELVSREPAPSPEFDLSRFSLAEVGADVLEDGAPRPAEPPPEPADLTIDPPGAVLVEPAPVAAAALPDTSGMSVAAAGENLTDQRPAEAAPVPDVSDITMAPVGADVVEQREITPPPPPPDTGSLSLADGEDEGQGSG